MIKLNQGSLEAIAEVVPIPRYDRSATTAGIVHFGVGGFHRAHQAMYIDTLLRLGEASDFAICGVGVLPQDATMRDVMADQDGLYTLVQKHADGTLEARVIGSIVEYLFAPDGPAAVVEKLAAPTTKIVSLTVTEGGYNNDPVTDEFNLANDAIARDLTPGAVPATIFGLITEALALRRSRGLEPFTIMSCDNVQGNGNMARRAFSAFAEAKTAGFGKWIGEHVRFPNSMVDRITPVTTDEDRALVASLFGIEDRWPVVCEPFLQWVLEDDFNSGRPPYDRVGVQLVDDVEPFELMKLRLLNASHQGMCYFGYLAGYRYAHEATADPLIATFLRRYMDEEATPTLLPVPGIDLEVYNATLIERFANPHVRDTLARLCAESSDRIPKWLLPVVFANLNRGGDIRLSAAIVASWARYAEAVDEQGEPIVVVDRLRDQLVMVAGQQRTHPTAFLEDRNLFGDLAERPEFVAAYLTALESLHEVGALDTLKRLLR
jgi:mannitol 2-dehydrogenase